MKLAIVLLALVGCDHVFGIHPVAVGEPTFVQVHAVATSNDSVFTNVNVPMGNVTANNTLVVAICSLSGTMPTMVTDDSGNAYTELAPATIAGPMHSMESDVFVASLASSAESFHVKVSFSGTGAKNPDVRVVEYSNVKLPVLDVETQTDSAVTTLDATLDVAVVPTLLVAANCMGNYTTDIPGFTERDQNVVNGDRTADLVVHTVGSYTATTLANADDAIINTLVAIAGLD